MREIRFATKGVIYKGDKVLLVHKSETEDVNPNTVDIPGGRLEFGETPEEGLAREIHEETGLRVTIGNPSRCWSLIKKEKDFQLVGVTFVCEYESGTESLSDEHTGFLWLTPEEILKGAYPQWLKREIQAAQETRLLRP